MRRTAKIVYTSQVGSWKRALTRNYGTKHIKYKYNCRIAQGSDSTSIFFSPPCAMAPAILMWFSLRSSSSNHEFFSRPWAKASAPGYQQNGGKWPDLRQLTWQNLLLCMSLASNSKERETLQLTLAPASPQCQNCCVNSQDFRDSPGSLKSWNRNWNSRHGWNLTTFDCLEGSELFMLRLLRPENSLSCHHVRMLCPDILNMLRNKSRGALNNLPATTVNIYLISQFLSDRTAAWALMWLLFRDSEAKRGSFWSKRPILWPPKSPTSAGTGQRQHENSGCPFTCQLNNKPDILGSGIVLFFFCFFLISCSVHLVGLVFI